MLHIGKQSQKYSQGEYENLHHVSAMLPQKLKDQIGKCYDLEAGENVCGSQQLCEVERQSLVEVAPSGAEVGALTVGATGK